MIPLAPRSCAFRALFVYEQVSWMFVLITTQVGFVKCSISLPFPQRPMERMLRSQVRVFPQGISPKLPYMQSSQFLGKSVWRGLVIIMVVDPSRQQEIRATIILSMKLYLIDQIKTINIVRKMDIFVNALLRPYRSSYSPADLGMKKTETYSRTDGAVYNDQEMKIQYSYFENRVPSNVCVVYCHCNSGSRVEGMQYLDFFIDKGWNACLFDFSGSGMSEGSHISLGHHEARDLDAIVNNMRISGNKKILLWGRSMGAATIIFYLSQTKYREDICGCVLDSPYGSLWSLIKKIGLEKSILPGFLLEPIIDYLREKIRQEYCLDIRQLEPLKHVGNISLPLLFITSQMDEFVKSEDVVQLYKQSSSRNKQLEYIDKAHNSSRDRETILLGVNFLQKTIEQKNKKKKQLHAFSKNSFNLTGGNMAERIVQVEKEKSQLKRMKSELQLNKENHNASNLEHKVGKAKEKMHTEASINPSMGLEEKDKSVIRFNRSFLDKRKAIKCSLAHIEFTKKTNNRILHKLSK